jgi:hypothetical protein
MRPRLTRFALPLTVAAILLAHGYVHGIKTGRWWRHEALDSAVARLDRLPEVIAGWRSQAKQLAPREQEIAGFDGYVLRRYESPGGQQLSVLVGCGYPGPVSLHTPDVCYSAVGYTMSGPARKYPVPAEGKVAAAELNEAEFGKPDGAAVPAVRVLWAWNAGAGWRVPANPRLSFAGAPALYKLYVIQQRTAGDKRQEDQVLHQFLRHLLPELQHALRTES